MRNAILILLSIMAVTLIAFALKARRSDRSIGYSLSMLLWSFVPSIAGSIITIGSTYAVPAQIGYYILFIGQDIALAYLLKFIIEYCNYEWKNRLVISLTYLLLASDMVQLMMNSVFRHAFSFRVAMLNGAPYFRSVSVGTYHRYVSFVFLAASMTLLLIKILRTSTIYVERYIMVFLSLALVGVWEAVHLRMSIIDIDTSTMGYAISGFLVYYFSIYYNPRFLLDRMLSVTVSDLPEALYFFDGEQNCIWANNPALELIGADGSNLEEVKPGLRRLFPEIQGPNGEIRREHTTGSGKDTRYYSIEKHSLVDKKGIYAGTFLSVRDNTENQRKLEREQYSSRHDALTGLYNREYLFSVMKDLVKGNPDVKYQVSLLDVSEFKLINDVFGKDFGDHVLETIANDIRSGLSSNAACGRLGGDSFGVVRPVSEFDRESKNEKLTNYVVRMGELEHNILMQAGIYEIDEPDLDPSIMVDRARMALDTIKHTYAHIAYYTDSLKDRMLWEQKISAELDRAIEEKQIIPYLQPIVDVNGKVVGAEALARWIHPEKGVLLPADFIPQFEHNGKISEVDRYIWRCACEYLKGWETKHPDLFLSVNISPIDFYYMDLRMELRHLAEEFDIEPGRLRLEITESVMMSNVEERIATINGLRDDGFVLEMDDFGSGFSSLNLLKDLPVDLIKLDMEFLRRLNDGDKARVILDGMIKLIESLGIVSLTEGVETEEQFRTVAEMGCRLFQGFHFAKPVPADEFDEYCRRANA